MKPEDFVYNTTYRGCLRAGIPDGQAANAASMAMERFKKGKNIQGGVSKMIAEIITQTKKARK